MAVRPPDATPYSPQELWYWNTLPLQDAYGAWNISTFGGSRMSVPVYRGQNIAVPYRAGQSQVAKYPDQRTVTLTMWADGQGYGGSAGSYPAADQHLAFNSNWQQLRQAFFTRGAAGSVQGQLQRNWYILQQGTPALVTSVAMAEIAGSMDLTMNGRTNAAFSVDLLLADPYFYGIQRTQAVTGSSVITALGEGIVGEGWPSAVNAFTVVVSGPCTVTNSTLGCSFTVSSGPAFPVTVDVLNLYVTDAAGANQVQYFGHAGSRLWMALQNGANNIAVSGGGSATFTWSDAYI
jgi:hypothetical protein